jgi:hypothetical protein
VLNQLTMLLSILSNEYKQIESNINTANENLSKEQIFAFVASTPESSSNAIDKEIEIKSFRNLQYTFSVFD